MKIIIFKQKGTIETFKWRNGSECSYWNCSEWVDLKIRMTSDIIFSQPFQIWGQSHRVLMTFVHRMWFVTRSSLRDFPGSCIMMSWRLVERDLRKQTGKTETHQTVNIINLHSSGRGCQQNLMHDSSWGHTERFYKCDKLHYKWFFSEKKNIRTWTQNYSKSYTRKDFCKQCLETLENGWINMWWWCFCFCWLGQDDREEALDD